MADILASAGINPVLDSVTPNFATGQMEMRVLEGEAASTNAVQVTVPNQLVIAATAKGVIDAARQRFAQKDTPGAPDNKTPEGRWSYMLASASGAPQVDLIRDQAKGPKMVRFAQVKEGETVVASLEYGPEMKTQRMMEVALQQSPEGVQASTRRYGFKMTVESLRVYFKLPPTTPVDEVAMRLAIYVYQSDQFAHDEVNFGLMAQDSSNNQWERIDPQSPPKDFKTQEIQSIRTNENPKRQSPYFRVSTNKDSISLDIDFGTFKGDGKTPRYRPLSKQLLPLIQDPSKIRPMTGAAPKRRIATSDFAGRLTDSDVQVRLNRLRANLNEGTVFGVHPFEASNPTDLYALVASSAEYFRHGLQNLYLAVRADWVGDGQTVSALPWITQYQQANRTAFLFNEDNFRYIGLDGDGVQTPTELVLGFMRPEATALMQTRLIDRPGSRLGSTIQPQTPYLVEGYDFELPVTALRAFLKIDPRANLETVMEALMKYVQASSQYEKSLMDLGFTNNASGKLSSTATTLLKNGSKSAMVEVYKARQDAIVLSLRRPEKDYRRKKEEYAAGAANFPLVAQLQGLWQLAELDPSTSGSGGGRGGSSPKVDLNAVNPSRVRTGVGNTHIAAPNHSRHTSVRARSPLAGAKASVRTNAIPH